MPNLRSSFHFLRPRFVVLILIGVAALNASVSHATELACENLFASVDVTKIGVLESAIEQHRANAALQRQEAEALITRLNLANDGWWPLDVKFVTTVETLVAKYRTVNEKPHRTLNQRNRNLHKIRRQLEATLQTDAIFPRLDQTQLRELTDRLLNHAQLTETNGINGVKHVLYRAIYFSDPSPAPMLRDILTVVDAKALLVSRLEDQRIVTMQTLVAARNAKSIRDLRRRREEVVKTIHEMISKTRPVPEDVITAVLSIAKDYRYARVRGATTEVAELRWKELMNTSSFFGGLAEGDGPAIGFEWAKVTNREGVIKMFVMNTSTGSPALALRYRDLDEIDLALKYLESP